MKRHLILFVCLLYGCITNAQHKWGLLYLEAGGGGGSHTSVKLGLNYVFQETNVLSGVFYDHSKKSYRTPPDYGRSLFGGLPRDVTVVGALMYGKMLYSNSKMVRYNLKGGIAAGSLISSVNFRKKPPMFFGSNYEYDQYTESTLGVALNPTVEFPFGRTFGLSVGLFSLVTTKTTTFGIEANILLGKVRYRRER